MSAAAPPRSPAALCPSDPDNGQLSDTQHQWEGIRVALTNDKGSIGGTQMGGAMSFFDGRLPDCHAVGGCQGLFFRMTYRGSAAAKW